MYGLIDVAVIYYYAAVIFNKLPFVIKKSLIKG